jgi:phage terminase Nu1 subunit (DNA packaging protein)
MQPEPTEPGAWVTITELAVLKGVGKATISERVGKLEAAGKLTSRRDGRAKLVNVAAFDLAVGETTDFARAQTAATKRAGEAAPARPPGPADGPVYTAEQARHMAYKADLAELELKRRRAEVIETAEVAAAMARCAEALVRQIDQMPSRADDLAAAVARDGAAGARAALKAVARDLRDQLAREMRLLEAVAAEEPAAQTPPELAA